VHVDVGETDQQRRPRLVKKVVAREERSEPLLLLRNRSSRSPEDMEHVGGMRGLDRGGVAQAIEHRAEVVLLVVVPGQDLRLPGSEPVGVARLQPLEVPAGVAEGVLHGLPGFVEPLPGVLAQRLQQEEALVAERLKQALVEERRELIEIGSRDRLGGVEGEGAAKDGEPAEGSLSGGVEQVVAPFDRRAQRSLPLGQIDRAAREQRQRRVQALQQCGGRQKLRPRRGKLDRERQVVQAPAHRCNRLVGGESAPGACCAADEEFHGSFERKRVDRQLALAAQMQRPTRGGQHGHLSHEELGDDLGHPLEMLEVVEHEQHASGSEPAREVVVGLEADRLGDGGVHRLGIAKRSERDEERPVEEPLRELRRSLQREPGLPRPARPRQRHEAHPAGNQTSDLGQLPLAPEERPRCDREVRPSERSERWEVASAELVDALGGKEVLEAVLTEVAKVTVHE
jgi:hypothetical protein